MLALLKTGDHAAFNEIHDRFFSLLYHSAYNVLRDRDACMDLLQEVFVWFWEHREQHRTTSIKGYLLMAVKYQVANAIRSEKVRDSFFDRVASLNLSLVFNDDTIEVRELKAVIAEYTALLPERCNEVLKLSREQHRNKEEIAAKIGISEKTVEAQLTKALSRLRTQMGNLNSWMFFCNPQ